VTAEDKRLAETVALVHWRRWGPYLSERQWGTVREDDSRYGTACDYFPQDHARARAYRWGEDGLLGICDNHQRLCFALALWNQQDPILKERLLGLAGPEGNHGGDVRECYVDLDSTPTDSDHGRNGQFRSDPHWRDLVLVYGFFHGDDGSSLGASHQTGWTGLVAKLLQQSRK
jgi:hypothetical protein